TWHAARIERLAKQADRTVGVGDRTVAECGRAADEAAERRNIVRRVARRCRGELHRAIGETRAEEVRWPDRLDVARSVSTGEERGGARLLRRHVDRIDQRVARAADAEDDA